MITTSESLLGRLKAENAHGAWQEFYHLYWGSILRYARKLGLTETQAQDVLQETMVALMRILPEFAYDRGKGRFRNFLLTIVHRKSLAALRRARRESEERTRLEETDTAHPFGASPEAVQEAQDRWREALMEEALRRLRDDPSLGEKTFAIFEAHALRQRPIAEIAAEFGVKENAIYQIKNRLTRRLQAETARLARVSGAE